MRRSARSGDGEHGSVTTGRPTVRQLRFLLAARLRLSYATFVTREKHWVRIKGIGNFWPSVFLVRSRHR